MTTRTRQRKHDTHAIAPLPQLAAAGTGTIDAGFISLGHGHAAGQVYVPISSPLISDALSGLREKVQAKNQSTRHAHANVIQREQTSSRDNARAKAASYRRENRISNAIATLVVIIGIGACASLAPSAINSLSHNPSLSNGAKTIASQVSPSAISHRIDAENAKISNATNNITKKLHGETACLKEALNCVTHVSAGSIHP